MDNRTEEIIRGQAYNCANDDTLASDKLGDERFFYERWLFHVDRIKFCKVAKLEDVESALDNPKILKLAGELHGEISKNK